MIESIPQQSYLETLWQASQAGLITWASVQQYQTSLQSACANHADRTAPANWEGVPLCADCLIEASRNAKREESTP